MDYCPVPGPGHKVLPVDAVPIMKTELFLGAVEINGMARRCQSLRLGPRDFVNMNNNNKLPNLDNNTKVTDNNTGDHETKLLMDNQV